MKLAINQTIKLPFIDDAKLNFQHPDKSFSYSFSFLNEQVIFIKSVGIINLDYAKRSNATMQYIEDAFTKEGIDINFYFINDSTKIKQYHPSASRLMQDFFEERIKNKYYQHVAIISNDPLIKLYIKTVNFLKSKKINSAHASFEKASSKILLLIAKENMIGINSNNFKKESDKEKIDRLEKENDKLRTELTSKVNDIAGKIKSITTTESLEPFSYEDADQSNIAPIYQSLSFLKLEMQMMVRNLKEVNKELEASVKYKESEFESKERRLESVIASSSDFIAMINTDYQIEYINPSFSGYLKSLFNVSIEIGGKWTELLPEEVKKITKQLLDEAKETGEGRKYISASKIHVDFTASTLLGNNKVNAYLIIGRNITEISTILEKLQKSKEKYKFITDNLNDVIWTHREDNQMDFVSASIYRQRGFTPKEYKNMSLEETMTLETANKIESIINDKTYLNHSKEIPLEFLGEYIKKDGSIMYGESIAYPVFDEGKLQGVLGITRDVSERVLHRNQIEQKNSELETILNNTDEQIISLNRNFEYVTINEVAKNFVRNHYKTEPKIGESILKYMSKANNKKILVAFKKVLSGENFHYIFRMPNKGKMEYLDSRFRPIFLNNEVFGISIFIKNITEYIHTQIALKENEQRLKRITNNALEGVWEYSFVNSNLYLSSRLKELVSYSGQNDLNEFSEYISTAMVPDDHTNLIESILLHLDKNKDFEFAVKVKMDGKEEKWLQIKGSITFDKQNDPVLISGVLIDVSKQKEQEKELKNAKERAEEMMQLKSNFLANMSHEVRTPLNGILGVTQLLQKEDLSEEINYYLKLQRNSGLRLLDTINNILSISRLDASQNDEDFKSVDLNSFIKNNIAPFNILAKQKNITVNFIPCKRKIEIPLNEHIFYQVFNNLMGNALKFTMEGYIEVKTKIKADCAQVIVKDTGIGISPDFIDRIFDVFEQESTGINRNYEGSGLGLAIVKRYIDRIGGEIKVESEKNSGTQFTLSLPLRKREIEISDK
jgi:PAS domain S-box-containing protein